MLVSVQVCIHFNPVAEGAYCLPLFLRIKDGKQLQLQLSAQAVAASAQLALAMRGSHSCQLAAAPIGELQPPLQQYTLRNAGPAPLQYRCTSHHGICVLCCGLQQLKQASNRVLYAQWCSSGAGWGLDWLHLVVSSWRCLLVLLLHMLQAGHHAAAGPGQAKLLS